MQQGIVLALVILTLGELYLFSQLHGSHVSEMPNIKTAVSERPREVAEPTVRISDHFLPVSGKVTAVESGTITILDQKGDIQQVSVNEGTAIVRFGDKKDPAQLNEEMKAFEIASRTGAQESANDTIDTKLLFAPSPFKETQILLSDIVPDDIVSVLVSDEVAIRIAVYSRAGNTVQ